MNQTTISGLSNQELNQLQALYQLYYVEDCVSLNDLISIDLLEKRATGQQIDLLMATYESPQARR